MSEPVIVARGLTRHYGRHIGVDSLDFDVKAGEMFGLLGPNGSGKTTTIRLLLGLIHPTRGMVRVLGHEPRSGSPLLARIGYVPGEPGLPGHLTGRKLLDLCAGLGATPVPLQAWICEVLALSEADLARPIRHCSRGVKQKIVIAAAIQHDPDLLLLDEPTSALDPLVRRDFMEALRDHRGRGKTVFFSSHVLSEVEALCDRVAVLRDGRIILDSTVTDLAAAADRRLWLRMPPPVRGAVTNPPAIRGAEYLHSQDDWLVYRVPPAHVQEIIAELADIYPLDFRLESAFEEGFLRLYRGPGAPDPAATGKAASR